MLKKKKRSGVDEEEVGVEEEEVGVDIKERKLHQRKEMMQRLYFGRTRAGNQ